MSEKITLKILGAICTSINSTRIFPHRLLKPPVQVRTFIVPRILTKLYKRKVHLGEKIVAEISLDVAMDLKGADEDRFYRALEQHIKYVLIIDDSPEVEKYLETKPEDLPKNIRDQLIFNTINLAYPLIIDLVDRHMLPMPLPIIIKEEH